MAPKSSIGSLSKMVQSVKGKKAAAVKPSPSQPSAPTTFKSNEFINDSDTSSDGSSSGSDSDSDDKIAAAKKKLDDRLAARKKAAAPSAKPKVNGTKETKAPRSQATKAPQSDSSSDANSDSESDNDTSLTTKKPTSGAKKVAMKALDSESSDSGSDSGSDSSSDSEDEAGAKVKPTSNPQPPAKGMHAKLPDSSKQKKKTAQESSSEASSSNSEEDDEVDPMAIARINGTLATQKSSADAQIARPAWLNNSDFTLRKASSDNPGKEVSDFLSKSNLEGKQVWYFTAPASLPITVLKDMEIDLSKAQSGGALLNHNGDAYGVELEPYATSTQIQLLIPSKGGEKYATLNRGIDSTVHLRRIAEFGGGSKASSTATDGYIRQPRPVREQPQNLRPRFTPIGVPTPTTSSVPAQKRRPAASVPEKTKPAEDPLSDSSSSSGSDSDVDMSDAPALPPPTIPTAAKNSTAPIINGSLKRKQPVDDETSNSGSVDSSDSEEDSVLPPMKTTKPPEKAAKRAKTDKPDVIPTKPTSSQVSNVAKASDAKKSTPVPPPAFGRSISSLSAASNTSSKVAKSSTSKKDKKDKQSKNTDAGKISEKKPRTTSQTPIPLPKIPMSN
ncbi:DNA-directed RNA polymerase I subunit RPA34.5-domain-containing protein [Xylariales sp. AK1849]|nr:DNA-directed RNA polymerase I subunit RPA34.5-domain-containing protein [Xylariales sp. AK1849]